MRAKRKDEGGGAYFSPPSKLKFFRSGCTTLDCVISKGRGWPLGRIINIVGDKSTGKTLLAIEAATNFAKAYPDGKVFYRESEEAFDESYAAGIGLPIDRVDFGEEGGERKLWETIEDVFEDLQKCIKACKDDKVPALYIIDSLDALSDKDEMKRSMEEGSYNLTKQKKLGQLFRRLVRQIGEAQICVIVISQVRDKIGVVFGKKTTRTGGRALDFYASLIFYLAHIETEYKTKKGARRAVGVRIKVKCEKNKVVDPFRECEFFIRFGYGIDDLEACLNWLIQNKRLDALDLSKKEAEDLINKQDSLDDDEYRAIYKQARKAVRVAWSQIETSFLPKRKKYA